MPKPFSEERKNEIITRYKSGQPASEIALALSIERTAVYSVLKRSGIKTKRTLVVLDDAQRLKVAARYEAGDDAHDIAKSFGCDYATVYNIIRKLGVATRCKPAVELTDEIRQGVMALAANGDMTGVEIADNFNISKESVFKIISAAGISIPHQRTHTINDSAFDILTPEAAYWIGFIFADGGIYESERGAPRLVVAQAEKDIDHLKKLRSFLVSTHALVHHDTETAKGGPWYSLSVRSQNIYDRLRGYGIIEKKLRVPTPELATSRDFWRGMIDGDGSLGTCKIGNHRYPFIRLVGQLPLMESFQRFLREGQLGNPNIVWNHTVRLIATSGVGAGKIIKTLYINNTVALERKNLRAQAIIAGDFKAFPSYKTEDEDE